MIQIFNQSRINLNLTTAYGSIGRQSSTAATPPTSLIGRLLARVPALQVQRASDPAPGPSNGAGTGVNMCPEQIKGRNFEVPGCGGFLLTGPAEHLGDYYEIGKEVASFSSVDEMIERIRYYLSHEDERRAIAKAGHERTLRNHTYEQRFNEIFTRIGVLAGNDVGRSVRSGHTQDVT
jgi:spore maturation protein CgeB